MYILVRLSHVYDTEASKACSNQIVVSYNHNFCKIHLKMKLFQLFLILCGLIASTLAVPGPLLLKKVIVKQPIFVKPAPVIVHRPIVVRKFASRGGWW
uniref:Uncharacterized protein n=1 Tax=Anopheles coluzzii TaxID=1518534 RepID=A0A6E8V615_ANOCL